MTTLLERKQLTRRFFLAGLLIAGLSVFSPAPSYGATLEELNGLISGEIDDGGLRGKVRAAIIIRAAAVFQESTPSQVRLDWAIITLANPSSAVPRVLNGILGINSSATVTQIQNVDDATIQSNVNSAVDALYP